jgi:hypothetical protein
MIKKFALKLILFTAPFWLVALSYMVYDPFKVLYSYDNLYDNYFVNINRDYASSQLFLQNKTTHPYNAFIFGSSRTMAFRTKDWSRHIGKTEQPFVFDASSEKLSGMWSKIHFLDQNHTHIKHALIIVCGDHTFADPQEMDGLLFIRHPQVDKHKNWIQFHELFFSSYMKDYFFVRYLDYQFFKTQRSYRSKNMEFIEVKVDSITNDLYRTDLDRKLQADAVSYYKQADSLFYKRENWLQYRHPQLNEDKINRLKEIKVIFDKHHTDYQIVISPLYDQKKLHPKDVQRLEAIFGKAHLHDFSGINAITQSKFNYYENSHYRPVVGKYIMDSIYPK